MKAICHLPGASKNAMKGVIIFIVLCLVTQNILAQTPTISFVSPSSVRPGNTIIIFGSGFSTTTSNDVVFLNDPSTGIGYGLSVLFATATQLQVYIPVGMPSSGTFLVMVNGIYSGYSSTFNVLNPLVTSFSPFFATTGDTVTIKGKYFSSSAGGTITVSFGGTNATYKTVVSDTVIKAVVGAGSSGSIAVKLSGFGSALGGFLFSNIPIVDSAPVINSFTPAGVSSWAAPMPPITIKGKYFLGTSAVSFCGIAAASFTVNSDSVITAVITQTATNSGIPTTRGNVSVTTSRGNTTSGVFTFYGYPTITSISPASGTGGDTIKVRGTSLSTITSIFVAGTGSNIRSVSDTLIVLIVGNGTPGTAGITAFYPVNTFSSYFTPVGITFTYNPYPLTITSFSPVTGTSGSALTIKGVGFKAVTGVSIGGRTSPSFIVLSDTEMIAKVSNVTTNDGRVVDYVESLGMGRELSGFIYVNSTATEFCPNSNTFLTPMMSGTNYQWQVDTSGNGFVNIIPNSNYMIVDDSTLILLNAPSSGTGYKYRCLVDGTPGIVYTAQFVNEWIGGADSSWENPANWGCGVVPDLNTDAVITSGTITLNSNQVVKSLTLSPTVNFTIASGYNLTITH